MVTDTECCSLLSSMHSCKLLQTLCQTCRANIILIYSNLSQGNFEKPDEEEIEQTMKDTAAALNLVVSNKLQAAQPKTVPKQPGAPTFIKMQDMPVDPMEPPKFRHKKVKAPLAGFDLVFGMPSTWLCSFTDCIYATMPSCEMAGICVYFTWHFASQLYITKISLLHRPDCQQYCM